MVSRIQSGTLAALAILAAATAVVIACIGVHGEFPLSDDWSYAWAARHLCETGEMRFLGWTGASLVLQAAWGALTCRLFGFSFEALRWTGVATGVLGCVATYLMVRSAGARRSSAGLAAATLGLGPLYLSQSFTFMTDVPFTAMAAWSGLAFLRGFQRAGRKRTQLLALGSTLAGAAFLIRQPGLVLALAAALSMLVAREIPLRQKVRESLLCLLPALGVASLLGWFTAGGSMPSGMENKLAEALRSSPASMLNVGFRGFVYAGLLLLPATLAHMRSLSARPFAVLGSSAAILICATGLAVREGAMMFYLSNVLYDFGVGALTLRDTAFLGLPPPVELGIAFRAGLTLAGLAGASLLATALKPRDWRRPDLVFPLVAAGGLLAASTLQSHYYFDRYILPTLPLTLAALWCSRPNIRPDRWNILTLAILATVGLAGTHDYLEWNRARWQLLHQLEHSGVEATEIDGGFEYNAWRLGTRNTRWPTDAEVVTGQDHTTKSWWWVEDDRWIVSFRQLPGYVVVEERRFQLWLPPSSGRVLLLRQVDVEGNAAGNAGARR